MKMSIMTRTMTQHNDTEHNDTEHNAECRYAECRYAECRYAQCPFAQRRGVLSSKLGSFASKQCNCKVFYRPVLELKTRPWGPMFQKYYGNLPL